MEKFHYFLYGKEFTLETDQKPLVSIYKKHMVDISPRVQRLIVRSFPYLPFHVVYKKGKDIPVADALSGVTPMDPEDNIQLPIIAVNMITTHILMSPHTEASASFDFKSEEREEIAEIADVLAPTPAPTPALERIEEQSTHTPGSRKSTRKNFGKPASSFSNFYM